jgi:hypothetical protein
VLDYIKSKNKYFYMDGFTATLENQTVTIGEGTFTIKDEGVFSFESATFEIEADEHFYTVYDLYFVKDTTMNTLNYQLDRTVMSGFNAPAYETKEGFELIHSFVNIEINKEGIITKGNAFFVEQEVEEEETLTAGVEPINESVDS